MAPLTIPALKFIGTISLGLLTVRATSLCTPCHHASFQPD